MARGRRRSTNGRPAVIVLLMAIGLVVGLAVAFGVKNSQSSAPPSPVEASAVVVATLKPNTSTADATAMSDHYLTFAGVVAAQANGTSSEEFFMGPKATTGETEAVASTLKFDPLVAHVRIEGGGKCVKNCLRNTK
ncbi:MAG: hypothetical protein ACLQK4_14355 [Acidimicrobiales bacterium]|jgi:hypothetical protein